MHVSTRKVAFAILVVSVALWAADDPMIGTWKLNLAKSKYSPGPAPKSGTTKVEPYGKNGITLTADGVDAQGKPTHVAYSVEADGKDSPVQGDPARDTVALKRINANTVTITSKKAGKVTTTNTVVASKDGKTRTVTTKGTDPQGKAVNNVAVYDKQ